MYTAFTSFFWGGGEIEREKGVLRAVWMVESNATGNLFAKQTDSMLTFREESISTPSKNSEW